MPFLRTVAVGNEGAEEPYRDWARIREVHEAGAILVRPDGFVAWRQPAAIWDDDDALAQRSRGAHLRPRPELLSAGR